jgi:DUF1009 family protein
VEHVLALMAGAGALPARAAREARQQGWRVVAFAFADAPGLADVANTFLPSRVTDIQAVLAGLVAERPRAAVFVGKFAKQTFLDHHDAADAAGRDLARQGLSDGALASMAVATLQAMEIEVLDQREFLRSWVLAGAPAGGVEASESAWADIRAALPAARRLAELGVGQTVVCARGVVVAVEAAEGTDETIRRGTRLAGPGAVVVKAVASEHDYRFDVPAVGAETVAAMAAGGAVALAVPRGKVLLLDAEEVARRAAAAGIALVTVDEE